MMTMKLAKECNDKRSSFYLYVPHSLRYASFEELGAGGVTESQWGGVK